MHYLESYRGIWLEFEAVYIIVYNLHKLEEVAIMNQDHNKQKQINSNNEALYILNEEETKLIETLKEVRLRDSVYYASMPS